MRLRGDEIQTETLSDASVDAQNQRLARMRERRLAASVADERLVEYAPNESRGVKPVCPYRD